MAGSLRLRVLIFEDGPGVWVAQVLEKDMAAHGPTPHAALKAVQLVLQAHVNFDTRLKRPALSMLEPAPQEFFEAYDEAEPLAIPSEQTSRLPAFMTAAIGSNPVHTH